MRLLCNAHKANLMGISKIWTDGFANMIRLISKKYIYCFCTLKYIIDFIWTYDMNEKVMIQEKGVPEPCIVV